MSQIDLVELTELKQKVLDAQSVLSGLILANKAHGAAPALVQIDLAQQSLDNAVSAYQVGLKNYNPSLK